MKRYIVQALVILFLGSVFGVGYNFISPGGIPLMAAEDKTVTGFRMVTTPEVQVYLSEQKNTTIVVDARSPEEFMLGHIPGAINIPEAEVDQNWRKFQSRLKQAELIIIYCSGGSCGTSEAVGKQLVERGIPAAKVAVDHDGLPGWMKAKNPIETGEQK